MGCRSRQAVGEEEEEDGESQVVPSFRSAFNEALLSASVSVIAAQSGESLSYGEDLTLTFVRIFRITRRIWNIVDHVVTRCQ